MISCPRIVLRPLLVAVWIAGAATAWAIPPPSYHLLFVLDASSSMGDPMPAPESTRARWWHRMLHRIYGTGSMRVGAATEVTKITAAQQALAHYVEGLPASTLIGLRVLGQRRWQGCEDSEALLDLTPLDMAHFHRTLERIQTAPGGPTPLAFALRQGARDFVSRPSGNNVLILITDGEEPCPESLPNGAELARREGIDLRIHVVDLGTAGGAPAGDLRALAKSTGGRYLAASDVPTLALALAGVAPVTAIQRLASAFHLHPGSWPVILGLLAAMALLVVVWLLVRSER